MFTVYNKDNKENKDNLSLLHSMFCLKFLLFSFFINLYNSFRVISFINHKPYNTLFMGCDYYIQQNLIIRFNDNSCGCINLGRERAYYSDIDIYNDFIIDKNIETTNLTDWEKIKQYHLQPKAKPLIIYNNHTFTHADLSNQYKLMIQHRMNMYGSNRLNDIIDIIISEERYER